MVEPLSMIISLKPPDLIFILFSNICQFSKIAFKYLCINNYYKFAMNGFSRSLELMQAIVSHYFRSMHITLFGLSCPESCLKRSSLEI